MIASFASSRWQRAAQRLVTLALGIVTAIVLVTAYTYVAGWMAARAAHIDGSQFIIPLKSQAELAALLSAEYALIAAVLCAPLWLIVASRGRDSAPLAAFLGFVVVMILMIVDDRDGVSSLSDVIVGSLPYEICGAIAGLVTWWAGPRRRPIDRVQAA